MSINDNIDHEKILNAIRVLRMLSQPDTRKILSMLEKKPRSSIEIIGHYLQIEQSKLYTLLSHLTRSQILLVEKQTGIRYYSLNTAYIYLLIGFPLQVK